MHELPASWTALCALAALLGLRHGLDADHLATIDGLTRYNARANPWLARRAGALFSLGHGAVVMAVALTAASVARGWAAPAWLEVTGTAVSIAFLLGLAFMNVRAVLRTAPDRVVPPVGVKGRLLARFLTVQRAWAVALVGALFAVSFDTLSQAALFALAGAKLGGPPQVAFVAALFVLGMVAIDGANGLWISRLMSRADRTAAVASRIMALAVAAISAGVGLLGLTRLVAPDLDEWSEAHALGLSVVVSASVLLSFALAMRVARRRLVPAR